MSLESAQKFLRDAVNDSSLREKFSDVKSPAEFIEVANELSYTFSTAELETVVKDVSKGVEMRRATGVWPWLRTIPWI
ncbi:MAG: Nif11-like leader peptide family natural product precursor [Geitlerinemataceae cyanobacterium]